MKVILYMATSVNGNITRGKSDSDWEPERFHFEFVRIRSLIQEWVYNKKILIN